MTHIAINPSDATVFAPTLPSGYDTHREPWDAPAPLTVSVLLHAPYYLDVNLEGQYRAASMPGGVGGSYPEPKGGPERGQVAKVSQYEFGLTNGLDRLLRTADRHGVPVAVALDAYGCREVPGLARRVARAAGEVVVRGEAATSVIDAQMSEAEERDYVERSVDAVRAATGVEATGWFGPERGCTDRTTQVLRESGITWFGDWSVDERPVVLDGPAAGLCAVPFSLDTEDSFQLYVRGGTFQDYEQLLNDTVDQLLADAAVVGPRFLGLSWAGWVLGQACYADVAERLLARLAAEPDVRVVLPSQVVPAA
ncbi:hypothetical protein [Cellulosimicrobium sp. CUA-896]|uniref:hypothetical protein n=1 Tax=Cellulosimicrobium sp. CUA-896 TaxID=1517881 RepID=UPI00095D222C|nr:hypothetical protein [Cellulosimicrobium sp. CUA-896]OLT54549.1 hypothetical protein BJF88_08450 [Cellulosimicrobium sp. CUA-896]